MTQIDDHLGDSHIFIVDALRILSATGGSIICNLDEHRRWMVRNKDVSVESVNLSRACAIFIEDVKNPERLT